MYIRFETELKFSNSSCVKGIFAAMGYAKRQGSMSLREHIWYIHVANWFNGSLMNPSCFEAPICNSIRFKAQSWFKLGSTAHLEQSLSVVRLLRRHGIRVNIRLSAEPGNIVYEDELQIVVVPNA